MGEEKSPSVGVKEIKTVLKVVESFFDESGNSERLREQMKPFGEWLLLKILEAISEREEESGLREGME